MDIIRFCVVVEQVTLEIITGKEMVVDIADSISATRKCKWD